EVLARALGASGRPSLVVLDDMHCANAESLELFGHVARLATGTLFVVCSRGIGLELGHPLSQRLAGGQWHRACEYLPLGGLSREDAGVLLEQAAGRPLDPRMVDAAYQDSGGTPFFLGELDRYVPRDGAQPAGSDPRRSLPSSIRAAVGLCLAG